MKIYDDKIGYPGNFGSQAYADMRIYARNAQSGAPTMIVVLAQPVKDPAGEEYQGLSITNGIERVASQIVRDARLDPDRVIWIKHYSHEARGKDPSFPEQFTLVTLRWGSAESQRPHRTLCEGPNWTRIARATVEDLIGEPY